MTKITPLGDSALVVHVRDDFRDAPARTVSDVLHIWRRIEAAKIPGVIELAPAHTTVAIYFDPIRVIAGGADPDQVIDWLSQRLKPILQPGGQRRGGYLRSRSIEIPICFDAEFAFDLDHVAQQASLSVAEVLDLYCAATYHVGCVGFTPGFPFLLGLPRQLATPRRASPRKDVPAGSVAIGGEQTGIYPLRSPGGWNLIGRTPLKLFDPEKKRPALLRAGDRVRFRGIGRDEFERLKELKG